MSSGKRPIVWVLIAATVVGMLTLGAPVIARTVADYAKNAGRLDGKAASRFPKKCGEGAVLGWAQVSQDTDAYIQVPGHVYIKQFRDGCDRQDVLAKGAGTGVYHVRFGEKHCSDEVFPPAPLVVTVSDSDNNEDIPLIPSYTTFCDDGIYAFEITLRDANGTPHGGGFTAHLLQLP